ncbi:ATP-binding cassette domain-containing protein [Marinicellulosiphila megalodicopiae]|uniref:ATP-binding cassette domain-containing protein n=1 Tax=Marinicellulosiphila megalodicopiae TaxID=2724896 RepID=UPI003BB0F1F4
MKKTINNTLKNTIKIQTSLASFNLDIEFKVKLGITCIIGNSGAGKTTLLRAIAGLDHKKNDKNNIVAIKQVWQNHNTYIATHKRHIAFAFQSDNLFTHLTVSQNINLIPYKQQNLFKKLETLLKITELMNKFPDALSGGEKQRVALFKALIIKSDIILLDEPLSAVDAHHKKVILTALNKLKTELNIPILYISHNYEEITHIADQIICIENGKKIFDSPFSSHIINQYFQSSEPNNIASIFDMNVDTKEDNDGLITLRNNYFSIRTTKTNQLTNEVRVKIFAKDVSICTKLPTHTSIINILEAQIIECTHLENSTLINVEINGQPIYSLISYHSFKQLQLTHEKKIWIQIKAISLN